MTSTPTPSRKAIRRLALARVISITGGAAAYIALNYTIYERTKSPAWVAATLFLTFGVAGFLMPVGGWLGDRFDRKKVMIVSDLAGAAAFAGMALVDAPWLMLVFAFLSAAAEAPFWAASSAAIPNLVEREEDLSWANGLVNVGRQAGIFVGPMIGAVVAVSADTIFLSNAVTFVISALIIVTVRGRFSSVRPATKEERGGFLDGAVFMVRDPILRRMALAWLGIVLGLGMGMVADVAIAEQFGTGRFGYGLIIAAWGGGSVLGSLAGRWLTPRTEPIALVLSTFGVGVTAIGVGVAPVFAVVVVIVLVMGVTDGLSLVSEQSIMQRRTPDLIRSRVTGAFDAVVHVGLGLSYLVADPAVRLLGPQGVYGLGGIVSVLSTLILVPVLLAARRGELVPARDATAEAEAEAGNEVEVSAVGGEPMLG